MPPIVARICHPGNVVNDLRFECETECELHYTAVFVNGKYFSPACKHAGLNDRWPGLREVGLHADLCTVAVVDLMSELEHPIEHDERLLRVGPEHFEDAPHRCGLH